MLKQGAKLNRKVSVKGTKDRIDIMSLVCFTEMDFELYFSIIERYELESFFPRLKIIIKSFEEYKYLGLNPRDFKLKKKEVLERLSIA